MSAYYRDGVPKQKSNPPKSNGLTKEFFVQEVRNLEVRFDAKLDRQRNLLEAKMDFHRKDAKEQITAVETGVHKRMDGVEKRMVTVELKQDALLDNVKFIREDIKEIKTDLKTAVTQN
ncbi:MAG: hypothetical protein HY609_01260 [Deltaproteobacteria bacterium]|nr:hypothetical protein [Deltaproteobacteria bacterium]MBI4223538.1 hypothetical protein [Deltaproteobacteria bacterium]